MKILWRKKSYDKAIFDIVKTRYKKNDLISTLVANRGINEDEVESFLKPDINGFYSPFDLPNMDKAVTRIIDAINKKENILIFGDYDVDGMTSTTVLYKYLTERGLNPKYYIPNKIDEGYGLSVESIDNILDEYKDKDKIDLIITVDCGITSLEEVEYAKENGLDIIITDHHEPLEELPDAIAVVDPKIESNLNKAKFRELAGVGVAFKLIVGISEKLNLDQNSYLKYLDIVALGTISDIVPMLSENRIIQKNGLEMFKKSSNPAISLLYNKYINEFNESTISFQIAPRINASGRLGKEEVAMKFLLSKTESEAEKYFNILDEINEERKLLSNKIYDEAVFEIKENNLQDKSIIILVNKEWHSGVTGIVASKIVDQFKRPIIVFSIEDGVAKGSGRTIPGVNIYNLVKTADELLLEFGGHEKAVGLSLEEDKISKLKEILEEKICEKPLEMIVEYDYEIDFRTITYDTLKEIEEISPFGEKNAKPDFLFRNIEVTSINVYGSMLKLGLRQNGINLIGIGFGLGLKQEDLKTKLNIGDKIYLIGKIEENIYMDRSSIQINMKEYNLLKNRV